MKTSLLFAASLLFSSVFSLSTMAATKLDANTIQGEYLMQSHDVMMEADVTLSNLKASMKYTDINGSVPCQGTYSFDEATAVLKTEFPNCGAPGNTISHSVQLKGQTVESLKAKAEVPVSISAAGEDYGTLTFSITKEK